METNFSGFVIDPAKCTDLSLEQKRELVHEIFQWADNAPEILQSWSRRELLQLICAEMGKERKYTGVTKPKMIAHLLRLVGEKNGKMIDDKAGNSSVLLKNQNGIRKKRKKEHQLQFVVDMNHDSFKNSKEEQAETSICPNLVCRASLSVEDSYCRRCSCCICYQYDDNKDPSLWLVCNSNPPYTNESCGSSCHLNCVLKHANACISKNENNIKLEESSYCTCCGKVHWLLRSWRKQLLIAKDARRVDVLCERLSLSHKILKGTEQYRELHNLVDSAVRMLKKEVGPLDKVSAGKGRAIVSRLDCGAEVQKTVSQALKAADELFASSLELLYDDYLKPPGSVAFNIQFGDISPHSVVLSLQSEDQLFQEDIIGCKIWHRSSDVVCFPQEPTFAIMRPDTKIKVSGLTPSTEYHFKVSPFSSTRELGSWETRCVTQNISDNSSKYSTPNSDSINMHGGLVSSLRKEQELGEQQWVIQTDSQGASTNSSYDNLVLPTKVSQRNCSKVLSLEDVRDIECQLPPSEPIAYVNSSSAPSETPYKPDHPVNLPDYANHKESAERQYEYCVKVIRWLEREGHMEREFRVKFLTWFSVKATAQERRVVSAFIDILIDEPASLVAQLIDTFMDGICSKVKPDVRKGFCNGLWR